MASGSDWAGFPYRLDVTVDDVEQSGSSPGSYGNRNGIFNKLLDNTDSWLKSIGAAITGGLSAKYQQPAQDNTPRVLAIAGVGVAAVVLIIAWLIIFKK